MERAMISKVRQMTGAYKILQREVNLEHAENLPAQVLSILIKVLRSYLNKLGTRVAAQSMYKLHQDFVASNTSIQIN